MHHRRQKLRTDGAEAGVSRTPTLFRLGPRRLAAQSSLDDLMARAPQFVSVRTPQVARLQAVLREKGLAAQLVDDESVQVAGSTPEQVAALAAEAGVPVLECVAEAAALEDVFLQLTSAHA